jgi:hypothetical protein
MIKRKIKQIRKWFHYRLFKRNYSFFQSTRVFLGEKDKRKFK